MALEVSGQFEGSLPFVSVDVHLDCSEVELVLDVDVLGLGVLLVEQGHGGVLEHLWAQLTDLGDVGDLLWLLDSGEGCLGSVQVLEL